MTTGLILFTYNNPQIEKPFSWISSIIRIFQTGKLKRTDHTPTHTAQTVILYGDVYVVDSDSDSLEPELFATWKSGRAWIHVFDPNVLTNPKMVDDFQKKLIKHSGKRYDFKSIIPQLKYQLFGVYKGETNPEKAAENFICSELTGYAYDLPKWYQLSPLNIFKNRFKYFPFGLDLQAGKPEDIIL